MFYSENNYYRGKKTDFSKSDLGPVTNYKASHGTEVSLRKNPFIEKIDIYFLSLVPTAFLYNFPILANFFFIVSFVAPLAYSND